MPVIENQIPNGGIISNNHSKANEKSKGIKMDDFLKILSATMSNPSFSGDDSGGQGTDYISQLVQFTTLEQLQELGSNIESTVMMNQQQQAISLMGKVGTVIDGDKTITGKIEKVKFTSGFATIQINKKDYLMSDLLEVGI